MPVIDSTLEDYIDYTYTEVHQNNVEDVFLIEDHLPERLAEDISVKEDSAVNDQSV